MAMAQPVTRGPLTRELARPESPVRLFLDSHLGGDLRDLQRRYRATVPSLAVPAVTRGDANPGTLGAAADWLLRFLLHPSPPLRHAEAGARIARTGMATSLSDLAAGLGVIGTQPRTFTGPVPGSTADPEHLARACWALALLTEVYRGGPMVAATGPLGQLRAPTADALLTLAPPTALTQLARFRKVFENVLMPKLASRRGPWALGPEFTGSQLIPADADVIAGGLLLDIKATAKQPSLAAVDLRQIICYSLLDFDDEFTITTVGMFSARYGYLATWDLGPLLVDLGATSNLAQMRSGFRQVLVASRPTVVSPPRRR